MTPVQLVDSNLFDTGILNELLGVFSDTSQQWVAPFQGIALRLFAYLAAIEMTWFGIRFAMDPSPQASLDTFFRAVLRKMFPLGMTLFIIEFGPHYLPLITGGFQEAGSLAVTGSLLNGMQPTAYLNLGVNVMQAFAMVFHSTGAFAFMSANMWLALFCMGVLALCFIAMTGIIVATLVEAWLVLAASPFLAAFSASRWTYSIAESMLTHLVRVAIKIFILYLYSAVLLTFLQRGVAVVVAITTLDMSKTLLFVFTCGVATILMFSVTRIANHLAPSHINWGLNPQIDNH